MTDAAEPNAQRAVISCVTLTYSCPACETQVDAVIEAEPDDCGGFEVALEERFDICSHCGQLLDFGACLTQEVR